MRAGIKDTDIAELVQALKFKEYNANSDVIQYGDEGH